ncbi:SIS domain-containing protein [Pseudonocardia nematodicida]|uniref:SIS domain-containing protein n=1 Tax=Pseudonocardia nematodicida TaxID=1206997 RepID=A0ABV1KGV9_9PSEU
MTTTGRPEAPGAYEPVLDRLGDQTGLRPSERKVAAVVAERPGEVAAMSMAELAGAAGVSEPTVMRFCTTLGFGGFQDFKFGLARELAVGTPVTHSAIEVDDPPATLVTKIFDHTLSSLDRTRRSVDTAQVERAIELLLAADEALFVGQGASGILAQDAAQKGVLFGIPCAAHADLHQSFMAAAVAGPGTVVVAVSHTGRTTAVLDIARAAKENGATVIALTGEQGPLVELADCALVLQTLEDTNIYTPTISRLAGLVLVDVLATGVALRRGPEHLERLARMKEGLSRFRGSTD